MARRSRDFGKGAAAQGARVAFARSVTVPTSVVSMPVTKYKQNAKVAKGRFPRSARRRRA